MQAGCGWCWKKQVQFHWSPVHGATDSCESKRHNPLCVVNKGSKNLARLKKKEGKEICSSRHEIAGGAWWMLMVPLTTAVRETSQHSLRMTEIERKGPIAKRKPQSISVGLENKRFSFTRRRENLIWGTFSVTGKLIFACSFHVSWRQPCINLTGG